jgi:hypothetical protein
MARTYRARNVIDYVSTRTGKYVHVEPGDEFDDMNTVGVKNEMAHGNIEEVTEDKGGEK